MRRAASITLEKPTARIRKRSEPDGIKWDQGQCPAKNIVIGVVRGTVEGQLTAVVFYTWYISFIATLQCAE